MYTWIYIRSYIADHDNSHLYHLYGAKDYNYTMQDLHALYDVSYTHYLRSCFLQFHSHAKRHSFGWKYYISYI